MQIIPAIDLIDGKCVRLTQGDYTKKTIYHHDPLEVALQFEAIGIKRLHLVDLDGAKAGMIINYKVLERIALHTNLTIDFGGGIKTNEDLETIFSSGAQLATIGSMAVKNKNLFFSWIQTYGAGKILLGADVKNEEIAINGWVETTGISVFDFIEEQVKHGIQQVFCTDISKDGLLQGPSVELYKRLNDHFPDTAIIASGGVSKADDLRELKEAGCKGVIIGKAIYENRINIEELKTFIA
jgi:phosphoribosylformimino-5-aminoimidazole carboxamide ribotide isomerase